MRLRERDSVEIGPSEGGNFRPTGAELEWWADERRPFRRRTIALQATIFSAMFAVQTIVGDSAGFLAGRWMVTVPVGIALVAGASWLSWRLQESQMREGYIVGKRIRDELLAGPESG